MHPCIWNEKKDMDEDKGEEEAKGTREKEERRGEEEEDRNKLPSEGTKPESLSEEYTLLCPEPYPED